MSKTYVAIINVSVFSEQEKLNKATTVLQVGMEREIKEIKNCRICCSDTLSTLFSIGNLYLSTFVSKKGEHIGRAPMDLVWCDHCTLVQLRHTASQELMYSRQYWYRSGLNKVIIDDLKEITDVAQAMVTLKDGDIVLDIGANDGTLLSFYPKGIVKIGCEPATNLRTEVKKHVDILIDDFWEYEKWKHLFSKTKAKIVTAIGMFYDMDDPGQFIRDAVKALDEDGIFIAQLMTAKQMLEKNDVGNICHEHLEFYSYTSLKYLFEKNGLEIFKVEENAINGGSYRLFAQHYKTGSIEYPERITKEDYLAFAKRIEENKESCVTVIKDLVNEGKKIYVYGASTKGNTILQYYALGPDLIKGAAEIHPEKIGKYTVATHIPIVREEDAREDADYFLVLPFAFRDAFIKREQAWLQQGGSFIFCTPQCEIYGTARNNKHESSVNHSVNQLIPEDMYKKMLEHTVIAAVDAIILYQGKVLLVLRKQEPCKGHWWVPGGRQYKGERGEEAIVRKVKEEIGLDVEIKKQVGVYDVMFDTTAFYNVSSGVHYLARVFLVTPKNIDTLKVDNNHLTVKWVDNIEDNLHEYVKTALEDAKVFEQ